MNITQRITWLWKKPWIVFSGIILMLIFFVGFGWRWTEFAGVAEFPIRNLNNRHMLAEKHVKESEIDLSNPLYFFFRCPSGATKDHFLILQQFQKKLELFLEQEGLGKEFLAFSLLNAYDYLNDKESFIGKDFFSLSDEEIEKWIERNFSRIDVEGALGGRIKGEYDYFILTLFPPQDFPELTLFQLKNNFLSQKKLPLLKLIWLYFYPEVEIDDSFFEIKKGEEKIRVNIKIDVVGWPDGRGQIWKKTHEETAINIFGGIGVLSFSAVLSFIPLRQALISLIIISIAFLCNRGMIGVFDFFLGNEYIRYMEDVFCILPSIPLLVAGFSFPLRFFYRFNVFAEKAWQRNNRHLSKEEFWYCAESAMSRIFPAITFVVVIAIVDYLFYLSFTQFSGSRSMWQVGIFSATGLFLSYFLTVILAIPLFRLMGGKKVLFNKEPKGKKYLEKVSRFFLKKALQTKPIFPISLVIISVVTAFFFVHQHFLITDSKPVELLKNLPIGKIAEELEKPGRPGFNINQVSIEGVFDNPKMLDQLWGYSLEMKNHPLGRTMTGPINFFVVVLLRDLPQHYQLGGSIEKAMEDFARERLIDWGEEITPEKLEKLAKEETREIWLGIRNVNQTMERMMKHFITKNHKQLVMLFTYSGKKATEMAGYVDSSYDFAKKYDFERVDNPSELAQYAEVDAMISQGLFGIPAPYGTIFNDIASQLTIVLIVGLMFHFGNRQLRKINGIIIRPFLAGVLAALPFVFSSACVLLVMMSLKIPFDIASSSIRSISVSVAVDLVLLYLWGFRRLIAFGETSFESILRNEEMKDEVNEVFIDFMTNTGAFLPLMLSSFPIIFRLGTMLVLSLVLFCFSTVWMVMSLSRHLIKKI